MRRADLSPDGDGALPLLTYADSDVGSSPRSIGASAGGRPASYPADDPLQKWDDGAFARVKLMCSYGGRILPRPHDNQLRYVGGDSRIAVVIRGITFSELTAKLSRMFGSPVMIKYQLPYEDLDALISVTSDEDLENMMEEYDRLQSAANQNVGGRLSSSARLRLFLFPFRLERSQTSSLSEVMADSHSPDSSFVDIINGFPVHSRVRSETSSIVSETPDYSFQSKIDALEEWAAAASYGSSVTPAKDKITDNIQGNVVSPATLFGSLLQQAMPSEATSAPGSPSPSKPKPTATGSSSSAPPAVLSVISSIADAASNELPTKPMETVGSTEKLSSKIHLGSADSSGSIPEQRKHVDSETLLLSDKNILDSSVRGVEQFLPAGLMDEEDTLQKYLAKGSFDKVSESSEAAIFDIELHQMMPEASRPFKGDLLSENAALTGQPIFDDERLPTSIPACNLNAVQGEEGAPSPKIIFPLNSTSASAAVVPPGLKSEQVVPPYGSNDKSKHHAFPVSPHAGTHVNSEEKVVQQTLPAPALNVMPGTRGEVDDELSRQTAPSLAQFVPSLIAPQQPLTTVTGEDMGLPKMSTASVANPTRDAESINKLQGPADRIPSMISPPFVPAPVHQEKVSLATGPSYLSQQPSTHGLEVPFSAVVQVTQAPPIQLPLPSQVASPAMGMVSKPSPPVAVPARPTNNLSGGRPTTGVSRPQSPPVAASQHVPSLLPQVRTTSPLPSMGPSKLVSNISQMDSLRGNAPASSNVVPTTIISTQGEGIGVWGSPYLQGDMVSIQTQGGDPMHGQRLAGLPPQLGTKFNAANISVPHVPAMPTRFRAVGIPLQQVAEGVPVQQAALAGITLDKKVPSAAMMRGAAPIPSSRPLPAAGGQFSYASAVPQSGAVPEGSPSRHNTPVNAFPGVLASSSEMPPLVSANPFLNGFQGASAYQDAIEGPPADQNQRYAMRQK